MKNYIFFIVIAFTTLSIQAQSEKTNIIIGRWLDSDKTEIIEIKYSNDIYIGNIVWLQQPNNKNGSPKLDTNNPNKKLRNKLILGSQNIFGLQNENGVWKNGEIYSHKRGGTIKFKVISISKTKLIIKISKGFFSKEIIYTRTK